MARTPKTPRQRAQEALAVEERRVKRLTQRAKTLQAELDAINNERDLAIVRRDYLKKHPDLVPELIPPTTSTGDNT